MRIQIFGARSVPAKWGGFDNTASELSTRFALSGHDVIVYIMKKYALDGYPKKYQDVQLRYIPTIYTKYSETIVHELISALLGLFIKVDINYILGCRTSFIYILYKIFGKKIIFNTDGLDFQRDKWGRLAKLYLKINYWIAAKISDHLIHDNTHIKKYFFENYKKSGAFISIGGYEYKSKSLEIIKKYDLKENNYYLIACRIEPENNIHLLIKGFIKSKSKKHLVIAGGVNYNSSYLKHLKEISDSNVIFLGPIYIDNHIEEIHYYSFAYLHGHRVGGTNPSLLKAMGCGNIIIANETNYNREVLDDNGVYFNENIDNICNNINNIENGKVNLSKIKLGAIERMNKYYTWDYSAQLHIEYFQYALGKEKNYRETF